MVALLDGRPPWAATIVWKLVSPSPGMLVWMSSTSLSARRITSALMASSRTTSDVVPDGGAMLTWRIFSEPALMNWVGRSGASDSDATKRTAATTRTPSALQRERRTPRMIGV